MNVLKNIKSNICKINQVFCSIVVLLVVLSSCTKDDEPIEYANGGPSTLAGNWVAFQFHGGELEGPFTGPYDITTAIDPNTAGNLIVDNIYNTGIRARAGILGDTAFVAEYTPQLEVINKGGYGIEHVSIDGYVGSEYFYHYVLFDFVYRLASASFENKSFSEDAIEDIIFFRAGLYDEEGASVDSILVLGYRKTGFEDVDYNN